MQHRPTRRQLLGLTGTTAVAGLAGCVNLGAQLGSGDVSDAGGDQDDTGEVTEGSDGQMGEEDEHQDEDDNHHEEGDDHHEEDDGHHDEDDNHHDDDQDEHGHNHDEGMPEEPSQTAEVLLETAGQQYHYKPHIVWIEPGGTVTWRLESGSHDAVAYHPNNDKPLRMPEAADPWQTELLTEAGATGEHTFETEGVYNYYCTPHESLGMVGTVIVGEPDPHEQPALEDPQDSLPEGARAELSDLAENVNEVLGHTH